MDEMFVESQDSASKVSHVLFITGPAGVGKTEVSHHVKNRLHVVFPNQKIRFLSGDVFSHISFPWEATEDQLDLKYACLVLVLQKLLTEPSVIVIDDVFRRDKDRKLIEAYVRHAKALITTVCLDADLNSVLERNKKRMGFQKSPESLVRGIHERFYSLDWTHTHRVDATRSISEVTDAIVEIFQLRH